MFEFIKKEKPKTVPTEEINDMIYEISRGVLGKRECYSCDDMVNSIYERYAYDDGKLRLEYSESSFSGKYSTFDCKHIIRIEGKSVWPSDSISSSTLESLRDLYQKHLEETKKDKERKELKQYQKERKESVKTIFRYVYPKGYTDDIISITDVKERKDSYYSSEEASTIYNYTYYGKISFLDGTVLCDFNNDIYHPGKWEDYVIALAKQFKDEEKRIHEENLRKEKIARQRKLEQEKRTYELNHAPIDDSKYFK